MPLGVVLLFPFTILTLLLVLFLRHPNSPGRMLLPSGGPPAIRYVRNRITYSSHPFPPPLFPRRPALLRSNFIHCRRARPEGYTDRIGLGC